jgi:methionyl-tRNA synthetase
MLLPFLPETGGKILSIVKGVNLEDFSYVSADFGATESFAVSPCEPLFARIDGEALLKELEAKEKAKKKAEKEAAKEKARQAAKEEAGPKEPCTFDDFCKVELVCAEVLECENVPKSEKLLKFKLNIGDEERQVLSGIAKFHKAEDLIGKKLILVKNLLPRKMMGLESHGMLLSTESEGKVQIIELDPATPAGASIG